MVQGPSARSQSHVGALLSEYRGGGFTTGVGRSASESDSSEDTRSAAVSATRAYSSVSILLQKWIAYLRKRKQVVILILNNKSTKCIKTKEDKSYLP